MSVNFSNARTVSIRLTAWVTSLTLTCLHVLPAVAAAEETTVFVGKYFEKRPDGTTIKYLFAGDQRIAAVMTSPSGIRSIQYFHPDHLGSTNVVTDEAARVVARTEYAPYGATNVQQGSATVAHQFTGQRLDDSTGLYYYGGRYYDTQLGRFIQPDPVIQNPYDPQMLNRYAYVRNNPINNVDPSGYNLLKKFLQGVAIALGVVAVIATAGAAAPGLALAAGLTETFVSSAEAIALMSGAGSAAFASAAHRMQSNSSTGMSGFGSHINAGLQGLGTAVGQTTGTIGQQAFHALSAEANPSPWQLALGGAGLAAILQSQGAGALRQTIQDLTQTSYDVDNKRADQIISYYATSQVRVDAILANRSFRFMDFHPLNRGGPRLHTNNTSFGARAEARSPDAVLQVYAMPRNLLRLPFAPPYTYGLNQIVSIVAQKLGYDAMAFPSTKAPGTMNYVFFNFTEVVPVTQVE